MAGDWIKMRSDLKDDPAVDRIARILGVDQLKVIGALFCFWSWADKHSVDGRVDGASSQLVDRVSCLPGLCDALVSVRWLEVDDDGVSMPNFERHNGESAKERCLKNDRQARWREKKKDVDAPPSTEASTREEKRREEKTTSAPNAVAFDAATGHLNVPDALMQKWADAFPAISLDVELSRAAGWLMSNPKNRKQNIARFLTNWLGKAQERAPARGGGQAQSTFEGVL